MNTGLMLPGRTQNMSSEGILLETQTLQQTRSHQALKPGDLGVLTLQYKNQGSPESLKVPCRIAHISANGLGIQINISRLSTKDADIIENILESETGAL